ncbi:MAG TPA: D-cysteine desulfhydrase family protein [Chthoniobacterales bacterium]
MIPAASLLDHLPRCPLGCLPTPLAELRRLSRHLGGPRIWIKRDDLTGLALGGNKVRKLEFLFGEARRRGSDCVLTGGATQSNHCRQTAAAAALLGLPCHLALSGAPPPVPDGNLLLDELLGAQIHWCGEQRKGETLPGIEQELRSRGLNPFVIPYGGSNATGALGFVAAFQEFSLQAGECQFQPEAIVFASSSGGTQAGLLVGAALAGWPGRLIGIAIDKNATGGEPLPGFITRLAGQAAERLGANLSFDSVILRNEYAGAGYGIVGELEREAIRLLARQEGILLDPVYTGRAFGGLLDLIQRGEFSRGGNVLFWHTGGTPALFPHAADLR